MYHNKMHLSVTQIANNTPEFWDTSCHDIRISQNYHNPKKNGVYHDSSKYKKQGRPPRITEEEISASIQDIKQGLVTDGADLQAQRFPDVPHCTVQRHLCQHGL